MVGRLLLALLALCLAACAPNADEEAAARLTFEQVRTGELDALQARLDPSLATPETRATFEQLRREFVPAGAPDKVERLSWTSTSIAGGNTTSGFYHRYDYADRVLIVETMLVTPPAGTPRVAGFHINLLDRAQVGANEFTLQGKSTQQLAFFAALWISLALMVIAFLGAIFTKGARPKWLLAIVAWIGAPIFVMNWSTGVWQLVTGVGLFNIGVTRGLSPLDPWMVKFHIPIGALIVIALLFPIWLRRSSPP